MDDRAGSDDRVAAALADAVPDREVAAVAPAGPSWNDKNSTVRVEFVASDAEPVFLKVATDGESERVARERGVVDFVGATTSVPVPDVMASETATRTEREGPPPYVATAPVAGDPLVECWSDADRDARAAMAREVGEALARVHALRFDQHGQITGGSADGLDVETAPWTDVLVERVEFTRGLASTDRFDHHFDAVIAAVEANRDLLDDAPAALVHGDPAMPNCFRTSRGVGFLDWEIAHVGDPARDLHRAKDQQLDSLREPGPEQVVDAFFDGYRERAGGLPEGYAERRPIYDAVRFLGNSGYVDKLADFVDEPADELADWIATEMDRRLDAISE